MTTRRSRTANTHVQKDELRDALSEARREAERLRRQLQDRGAFAEMVGHSEKIRQVYSLIESELFGHEKGAFTGAASRRQGCFELAHKGTLLLDEIAEMPALLQAKLLRVIEERQVRRLGGKQEISIDVHLLAATNRDPEEAVHKGTLRRDLLYRLNVIRIHVPSLRDRKEDLPLLAQHLVTQLAEKHGRPARFLSQAAISALQFH